jgi:DNA-binding NtrC family response regulator
MTPARFRICLIEDDPIMGESLCFRFELEGIAHDWHRTAREALAALKTTHYTAMVSDIRLPDMGGDELFEQLHSSGRPVPPTLFITGYGSIDHAVRLLKAGAADYITKPFDLDALIAKVRQLVPPSRPGGGACREPSLGISPSIRRVEEDLCRFAAHPATVLITGESGVGKEYAARRLHGCADPDGKTPFVAINCAAVPDNLLEAELFGHEKGAFTGALRSRKGLFEQAHGGTLFLDEVGETPPSMQTKLLRVVQERQLVRVGGNESIRVDVRLVCATNRDLKKMVEQGTFREDLFYRINVLHVHLPPLRERPEDVVWFARRFVTDFNSRASGEPRRLLPAAEQALLRHPWPGNLRELSHTIERACILADQSALSAAAFDEIGDPGHDAGGDGTLRDQLLQHERHVIERALALCGHQIAETAAYLGISRKNLWERMRKLDIPN